MKYSPFTPPYSAYSSWSALVDVGEYKIVSPFTMAGLLPQSLLDKSNSILLFASASGNSTIFFANINRVDTPASAIDQQPYVAEFDHANSSAYGGFVDHGNWDDRTTRQSQNFFNLISASGTGYYFQNSQMPNMSSGLLSDLPISSHHDAFRVAFSGLQKSKE